MEQRLKEDFLHYVWKFKQFETKRLKTTCGQRVRIEKVGIHNRDAGPDFGNATVKIGPTRWVGNVEIHIKASDWLKHGHQNDPAYNNVILHVVFSADKPIYRNDGQEIPCIELKQLIPDYLLNRYEQLVANQSWVPCSNYFDDVPDFVKETWLERLLIERMEEKTLALESLLVQNRQDWEYTFYQLLARNFGMKVNALPFELLAGSLPLNLLRKHRLHLFQIEALIFGQAGMLKGTFNDAYPRQLKREFNFLAKKYRLKPMKKEIWKFSRLRPANFPTLRLAQFAKLMQQSNHLFRDMLEAQNVQQYEDILAVQASEYWENHYVFDKKTHKGASHIGRNTLHLILINSMAPMLFLYGHQMGERSYLEQALRLLESLAAEDNRIIRKWKEMGCHADSAARSQALLQLKNHYCNKRKCVNCAIGNAILKEQGATVK